MTPPTLMAAQPSARAGHAPVYAAVLRNVAGGALAMALTYGAGSLLGAAGI